ncbi:MULTISPECIES: hypothetical protein [unclassified Bartonella]|nr:MULTISPECIES: hypothetical protein [unclassified Bartonella]
MTCSGSTSNLFSYHLQQQYGSEFIRNIGFITKNAEEYKLD